MRIDEFVIWMFLHYRWKFLNIWNLEIFNLELWNFKIFESWNFRTLKVLKYEDLRILKESWILENLKYCSENNVQRICNKNFEMVFPLRCSWHFRANGDRIIINYAQPPSYAEDRASQKTRARDDKFVRTIKRFSAKFPVLSHRDKSRAHATKMLIVACDVSSILYPSSGKLMHHEEN